MERDIVQATLCWSLIHQFKTNSAYTTELIIYIKISFTMHPFRGND